MSCVFHLYMFVYHPVGNSRVSTTVFMRCDRSKEEEKGKLVWEKVKIIITKTCILYISYIWLVERLLNMHLYGTYM